MFSWVGAKCWVEWDKDGEESEESERWRRVERRVFSCLSTSLSCCKSSLRSCEISCSFCMMSSVVGAEAGLLALTRVLEVPKFSPVADAVTVPDIGNVGCCTLLAEDSELDRACMCISFRDSPTGFNGRVIALDAAFLFLLLFLDCERGLTYAVLASVIAQAT